MTSSYSGEGKPCLKVWERKSISAPGKHAKAYHGEARARSRTLGSDPNLWKRVCLSKNRAGRQAYHFEDTVRWRLKSGKNLGCYLNFGHFTAEPGQPNRNFLQIWTHADDLKGKPSIGGLRRRCWVAAQPDVANFVHFSNISASKSSIRLS